MDVLAHPQIVKAITEVQIGQNIQKLMDEKGILQAEDGNWIHFDYVPGECDIRSGSAAITGKICVIGSEMDPQEIAQLFGV